MKIAITGHRPPKIGGYHNDDPARQAVRQALFEKVLELYRLGFKDDYCLITGGALGIDQDAAFVAYQASIPFIVAVPFVGQEARWPNESKTRYRNMLTYADANWAAKLASGTDRVDGGVVYVNDRDHYRRDYMQDRNQWMVDRADALIAVWDGSTGGTANCVGYAEQVGTTIYRIDPAPILERVKKTT